MTRNYSPWPLEEPNVGPQELDVTARIESPRGWLNLEDDQFYRLHSDTMVNRTQNYRQRVVTSEWIEGTFPVSSVRDNTVETIAVWVLGSTFYEYRTKQDALTDCFEQLSYQVMFRFGDMAEYWQCFPAEYSIEVQREFRHAIRGLVRAQVPRLPQAIVVPAAGDEQ